MTPEEQERLKSLVEHHRSEQKNYAGRAGQCDSPEAAEWLNAMADKHGKWADDIETILRGERS